MSLLSRLFKREEQEADPQEEAGLVLAAPVTGTIVPLKDVPDPVISEKIAGDGCAFVPEGGSLLAPCDGTLSRVLSSGSAATVRAENGTEIYLRVGIGTSLLTGKGFECLLKEGDSVHQGDEILRFDLSRIPDPGKSSITTMIVISSSAPILRVASASGHAEAGATPCAWVYYRQEAAPMSKDAPAKA
ncbi:MAG: glucose PTS transporter subunit IIA [Aeromonadales bacterium]|nr:glucose PTS transporter subunit IIA [Aeromonadales bacterium]MDY2891574.1 glucose PTS transporter subunit IIA [Succinivibrio sp.]